MCEEHRNVHNEVQRKFDRKRRALIRMIDPYYVSQQQTHVARPSSSSMSPSMENIMPTPLSEMKLNSTLSLVTDVAEMEDKSHWSAEEVEFLQTILMGEPFHLTP